MNNFQFSLAAVAKALDDSSTGTPAALSKFYHEHSSAQSTSNLSHSFSIPIQSNSTRSSGILDLPAFNLAGEDDDGMSLSDLADAFQAEISENGNTGGISNSVCVLLSHKPSSLVGNDKVSNCPEGSYCLDYGNEGIFIEHNGVPERFYRSSCDEGEDVVDGALPSNLSLSNATAVIDLTHLAGSRHRTESDKLKIDSSRLNPTCSTDIALQKHHWPQSEHTRAYSLPIEMSSGQSCNKKSKFDNINNLVESNVQIDSGLYSEDDLDLNIFENQWKFNELGRLKKSSDIYVIPGRSSGLGLTIGSANICQSSKTDSRQDSKYLEMIYLFRYAKQCGKVSRIQKLAVRNSVNKKKFKVASEIIPFDFKTPSPDDIVKNSQKKAFK